MSAKPVEIESRNLERQEAIKDKFPPGLNTRQARINYALNIGLEALAKSIVRDIPITNQNPPQIVDADRDEIKKTA